jgi:hypothetical protein
LGHDNEGMAGGFFCYGRAVGSVERLLMHRSPQTHFISQWSPDANRDGTEPTWNPTPERNPLTDSRAYHSSCNYSGMPFHINTSLLRWRGYIGRAPPPATFRLEEPKTVWRGSGYPLQVLRLVRRTSVRTFRAFRCYPSRNVCETITFLNPSQWRLL